MKRLTRLALALAAGLCLLSPGLNAVSLAAPAPAWPQNKSDLPPDPAIRFGALPNGMRYALMKNATPSGQISIRFRFGTGSLEETDAQQGLAHFLEHMAFNGSTNVPKGEMIKTLERHGLAFGADTNASTDWTQTVYQLDLPKSDPDTIDTGLMLMRELGGRLTLAPDAVDGERGVVLSEERARDTPGYRVFKARLEFLLKDQLAAKRMPIGTVEVLQSPAAAQQIRAYYDAYYRPERATLILVGDFDVDAMEAKVRARFSDWQASGPPPAEPDLGQLQKRGSETRVMVEPGSPLSIQIAWTTPFQDTPDSEAKQKERLIERLALAVLNRRLDRLARAENPPFIGAAVSRDDLFESARVASLSVTADADGWKAALTAAEEARRRAVQYGLRQEELDREVAELRAFLRAAVAATGTRRTPALANGLVNSLDDNDVFTSPATDLALFERVVQGLTAAQATEALKKAFEGNGPLLFMATPKPIEGGDATVAAAFRAAQTSELAPLAAIEARSWPYESFGPPGKVAEEKQVLDLDTTFIRYENGVRLTVKPTKFRTEQVLVSVRFGGGKLDLPKNHVSADWAAGFAFIQGGLRQISLEDAEAVLASKIFSTELSIGDDAFTLSGRTRTEDLDTQLQILAAYMADPGWRPEGFQRMRTYGLNLLRQMEATPEGVMRRDLDALLHSNDPRWAFPDRKEIEGSSFADVRALLEKPLAQGAIEVIVVGDVDLDRVKSAVGATFGALKPRPAPPPAPPAAKEVRFPAPAAAPVVETHKGRADQAIAFLAWPTTDFFADPQKGRDLRILQLVMEIRLIEQIRMTEGATYSPGTDWDASIVFPGYGYVSATVEIPPAKVPGFYASVAKIAADLRDKPVSADELERAKKPRIEAIEKAKQTNEYWLGQLAGGQTDARRLDAIRASIPGLERVTAADVQRAARTYLNDAKAWKFVVLPEGRKLP
jgi:zinc protease